MLPPLAAPSALVQAFSTLSRRGGDTTLLHPVLQRLTGAGTVVADLRDLHPATLDALPDGFLHGLGSAHVPRPADHPSLIALPDGCTAATVNRFLRELSGTECLSAPLVRTHDAPVDVPAGTALRLFETTEPCPALRNLSDVPVLFRLNQRAPSCVPPVSMDGDAAPTRLAAISAIREALGSDDCRLELPQARAFGTLASRLADLFAAWSGRADARGMRTVGPAPRVLPDDEERGAIARALRMVPRELLSAPAAITIEDLLPRLQPLGLPPPHSLRQGLDVHDMSRIAKLLEQQWQIACPRRGAFRPMRPPRDLVTLARLQRWTWPDEAYVRATRIDAACKARHTAADGLRKAWEAGEGLGPAILSFADLDLKLPEGDLLRRMGLLQVEALAARHRSRHVSFADPLAQADDPS